MSTEVNVLHVDDDPSISDLTATFLEREDDRISVNQATSAEDGLEMLSDNPPDCIISDFDMPEMDGIGFLKRVREDHPDLPFLLYTGKGSEEVASEAISAGVTDYLQKDSGTDHYSLLANRISNAVAQARAEQEVERLQQYYSQIIEHASDYLMIVNELGQIDYISPAVERVMGYTPDELNGVDAFDTIHPNDLSVASEAFSDLLEQPEQERTVEYRARHADGSWRWIEVRGRNLLENTIIDGILVSVRDITTRVEQQQELRQQNDLFAKAQDIADVGAWTYDPGTEELNWTEQVYRIHGLSPESNPSPETAIEFYHPDDQDSIREAFEGAVRDGDPYDLELRLITTEDEQRWVRTQGDPQVEDGETIRVNGTIQDITDRKEREQEIKDHQEQFRYVEEVGEIGYWELDLRTSDHLQPVGSKGVADILEVSADEQMVLDQTLDFFHPEDRPTMEHSIHKLISDGEPYDLELRISTAAGTDRWIHTTGEPVERAGEVVKVRGIIQDITQRKHQENAVADQNERLKQFASVVSHDLRNPLNVIEGRVELAQVDCESEHLDVIGESIHRMNELIEDLLTLAREGDTEPLLAAVNLPDIINRCWQNVDTKAAELNIQTEQTVMADDSQLQQVLENLFRNAIEHGGCDVTITVGAIDDGFYVADDGHGLPEAAQDDLFEYGFSTTPDGTGFGLSIVNDIVKRHDWSVSVTDGDKRGARFEITGVEMVESKTSQ